MYNNLMTIGDAFSGTDKTTDPDSSYQTVDSRAFFVFDSSTWNDLALPLRQKPSRVLSIKPVAMFSVSCC